MGEIVNLRRVKKSLARAAATEMARESRVKHGRTKAEKANDARTAVRREAAKLLDCWSLSRPSGGIGAVVPVGAWRAE